MLAYVLHDTACAVVQRIEMSGGDLPLASDGHRWTEVPFPAEAWGVTSDGEGGFKPAAIVVPEADLLAAARDARWVEAKAYRDAMQSSVCVTPSGVVDIDADSQRRIVGAATAAGFAKAAGTTFSVDWTMHDNTVVTMDADAVIAMGMAVVTYLDACQRAGTAIRAAIDAAQDTATLAAIDITAGYPA